MDKRSCITPPGEAQTRSSSTWPAKARSSTKRTNRAEPRWTSLLAPAVAAAEGPAADAAAGGGATGAGALRWRKGCEKIRAEYGGRVRFVLLGRAVAGRHRDWNQPAPRRAREHNLAG